MSNDQGWQQKYNEALLELRPEQLLQRIDVAMRAIAGRVEELEQSGGSGGEELRALEDAKRRLRVLSQTECSTKHFSEAGTLQRTVAS